MVELEMVHTKQSEEKKEEGCMKSKETPSSQSTYVLHKIAYL